MSRSIKIRILPGQAMNSMAAPKPGSDKKWLRRFRVFMATKARGILGMLLLGCAATLHGQILDANALLQAQTFWDNRDWAWYRANIPLLDTPDPDINTTYYYRWELVTKHLTYGSPNSGYSFTEFIDRPFWSGAYGAISCPAGHQLYEVRWLRSPEYAQDYARYWLQTPGAQPRNYSTWLADAIWAVHQVHGDASFVVPLLPGLTNLYAGWEKKHFVPETGLFWQTGHDDGMEFNIQSRQTKDILRGAPAFRPTINSYMWADARAIEQIARLAGQNSIADRFATKAESLRTNLLTKLWDPKREFFFPMHRDDEEHEGHKLLAGTLTYQSGAFAGNPHGRELHGYVPWQFNLPDARFDAAWKYLMDPDYFFAPFGPLTVERNDPQFKVTQSCCWWSGQSWPYATTQTLLGLANQLNRPDQTAINKEAYFKLLKIYTLTHRKDGKPYLAEGANPDTGSFEGYDQPNHSEHYFHSGYTDLIITGLIGLRPRADSRLEIHPLAPDSWDYFALDRVLYHRHEIAVIWDRSGTRYGRGKGLRVSVDGVWVAESPVLTRLEIPLPPSPPSTKPNPRTLNFAVNNDGDYYPRLSASYSNPKTPLSLLQDGNAWYHVSPANRWTTEGSPNPSDECILDLGTERSLEALKLYFLNDGSNVAPPSRYEIQFWSGSAWTPLTNQVRQPLEPTGRTANSITFPRIQASRLKFEFVHSNRGKTGLTEIEAWGPGSLPYRSAPPPPGNLALNRSGRGFPRATASFTSPYGDSPQMAIDGRTVHRPTPMNRWTSYGSPNATDWLEVDFGSPREVGRAELHIYDDGGGVQAPEDYTVEYWTGGDWEKAAQQVKRPATPVGGAANSVTFTSVTTLKLRILFSHRGAARSGVTELEIWRE